MNEYAFMLTRRGECMAFRNRRAARCAGKKSGEARRAQQMEHVGRVFVQIQNWRNEGCGWRHIADMLNAGEVGAPRGGCSIRLRHSACTRRGSDRACSWS